ncbi:MAG TPA: GNAT family N-acetyltransferase [Burkholderiaceae bacterium]|nr:GNAT family N-acetyltransferase [Burkholderiaceae bacterium]
MDSRIRFARHEDLPGVQRLYKALRPSDPEFPPPQAEAQWSHVLDQPHIRIVVAEQEGLLAATCMLALIANFGSGGRPIGLIEHVITLPRFRGKGLAAAVMRFALDCAWTHECCKVMLLSGAQRDGAHRLYESLGFRGDVERGFVVKPAEPVTPVKEGRRFDGTRPGHADPSRAR